MLKYKNYIISVILVIIWSLFFSIYKYYTWWLFDEDFLTLEYIAAYLSLWWFFSFIIWWFIYELLKERKFHFIISTLSILAIIILYLQYLFPVYDNIIIITSITIFIWFTYSFWVILRSILISTEINKNYASDTLLNWIANISFISSLIIWSILWWYLVEKLNEKWVYIILLILLISALSWLFLSNNLSISDNKNLKSRFKEYKEHYIRDFLYVFKKYYIEMIFLWMIIVIATIISQKAIQYIVENTDMKQSIATFILLASALWSVIWNVLSMKINKNKWYFFMICSFLFWISTIILPFFLLNFIITILVAFVAWVFFWIVFNLLESDYLKNIAIDDKKSYWWTSLWLISSLVIWIMMILIDEIDKIVWITTTYIILWIILFIIWILIYFRKK